MLVYPCNTRNAAQPGSTMNINTQTPRPIHRTPAVAAAQASRPAAKPTDQAAARRAPQLPAKQGLWRNLCDLWSAIDDLAVLGIVITAEKYTRRGFLGSLLEGTVARRDRVTAAIGLAGLAVAGLGLMGVAVAAVSGCSVFWPACLLSSTINNMRVFLKAMDQVDIGKFGDMGI